MRAAPVAVGAAVVAVIAVGMGVAVATDHDDSQQVDAVSVGDVTVDPSRCRAWTRSRASSPATTTATTTGTTTAAATTSRWLTSTSSWAGAAPWQGSEAAGDALGRDEIVAIALDAVGADSRLDSVDREDDGGSAWEVEVHDAYGQEQRVLLDAAGTVLDIRPED